MHSINIMLSGQEKLCHLMIGKTNDAKNRSTLIDSRSTICILQYAHDISFWYSHKTPFAYVAFEIFTPVL